MPPEFGPIIQLLKNHLGMTALSAVESVGKNPFHVLVSTMISLRTKDEVTAEASRRLLSRAPDPASLVELDEGTIQKLIYPAGFYRMKAKHLRESSAILVDRFDGKVPHMMEELLGLPGVGRKTANLVRNLGYGLDGICVDTHVHRISNRTGWITTKTPEETEKALEKVLPVPFWIEINGLLVRFGQTVCTPVSPFCSHCPFLDWCPKREVARSR